MTKLSAADLVQMWESAANLSPVERALALLESGPGFEPGEDLASLSVGARDARLLALRESLFGPRLCSLAECPACGTAVEFALDAAALRERSAAAPGQPFLLNLGETVIRFRLINSGDLAEASRCSDFHSARRVLASRCVVEATRGGNAINCGELPDGAIEELAARLAELDPQADLEMLLSCPGCAGSWSAAFDIASFLWQEVSVRARQLLGDVHALAWAYGWREADVLAMSDVRRRHYLALLH
jgi:hypothetical protein